MNFSNLSMSVILSKAIIKKKVRDTESFKCV
jgi:hypothetical protein